MGERETWYVLEDGTAVHPNEVSPDEKGALKHRSGALVAMRGDVPRSRGVDPDEERAKAKDKTKAEPKTAPKSQRDMKPENDGKAAYKTR